MTCVVALKHPNGSVLMGADSAAANSDLVMRPRVDPKIYRVGPFLLGFTTSYRMGQLLGYALDCPQRGSDVPVERFMATTFIDAVRECLKTGGFARSENSTESGGTFLVAYEGRVFHVYDDYQVGESNLEFDAAGCGEDMALGSMFSTRSWVGVQARAQLALEAAAFFSAGVRGPFTFRTLEAA